MSSQSNIQNQSQSQCTNEESSDQNILKLAGSESPRSSPKHSSRQPVKKDNSKIENPARDPSPLQPEKIESEQQVNKIFVFRCLFIIEVFLKFN